MPASSPQAVSPTTTLDRILLCITLAVTAVLSLTLSTNRLMWNDEFLSFYSDSLPTARSVVDVQLHHPISLDPPTYHLLSHFSMGLLGPSAIALRLPALAGFLLMELALFALVRRIAGGRAAVIAALFPLLTNSFRYSAEGRPYGWLLGLYACAFACWYIATENTRTRPLALIGMALCIAAAITSHYFGILIVIPIAAAELVRIRERRSLDLGITAAIVLGLAAIGIILPFQHGLAPYRTHYYITKVSLHAVTQGYRELFISYTRWPVFVQKIIALAMLVATVSLIAAAWRRFRARPATESSSLWAGLTGLALLPFFGFLLGRFVTHTMEVRYVIAALLAFAITIAIVLERRLASRTFYLSLYAAMLAVSMLTIGANIMSTRAETKTTLATLQPTPALTAALATNPTARIYTQSLGDFYRDTYYVADPKLRSRFTLLYDEPLEVTWLKHNTNAVTAANMQHFAPLNTLPYGEFTMQPHALLLDYGSGWEWVPRELRAAHQSIVDIGPALGGELLQLSDTAR